MSRAAADVVGVLPEANQKESDPLERAKKVERMKT